MKLVLLEAEMPAFRPRPNEKPWTTVSRIEAEGPSGRTRDMGLYLTKWMDGRRDVWRVHIGATSSSC